MKTEQERVAFAGMKTEELKAYQNVLNYSQGTVYVDPSGKVSRHRMMVDEELATRV